MSAEHEHKSMNETHEERGSGLGLALALAALAAIGAGIAIQQMMDRRLSAPEMARLKFYRYLHEKGRLES